MSGYLNITNDLSDAQAVVLTLDSKGKADDGTTERMGASLKVDIGRTVQVKLPDYLLDDGELKSNVNTDAEPTNQKLERQAARIKFLESLQHNHLVSADETDNARMQDLMKTVNRLQKENKGLKNVQKRMEADFEQGLEVANEEVIGELARTYKVEPSKSNIRGIFNNSDPATKADMYGAVRASLDEVETNRASRQHHATNRHLLQDKDAKHIGDTYRGPDSTTDFNDVAQTRDPDSLEEGDDGTATANAAEATTHAREHRTGRSRMVSEDASFSPTGHQSRGGSEYESHKETQEEADKLLESSEQETDNADAETSFEDTSYEQEQGNEINDESQEQTNETAEETSNDPTESTDENLFEHNASAEDDNVEAQDAVEGPRDPDNPQSVHPNFPHTVPGTDDKNAPHNEFEYEHGSGSSTEKADLEDRPVIMDEGGADAQSEDDESVSEQSDQQVESSQEDDDDFRADVNKLKNAQLDEVEAKHDLSGEGNQKVRKDALKDAYDNADEEDKQTLRADVQAALEG